MFKKVETVEEHIMFQDIYETFAEEQKFHVEGSAKDAVKYLFFDGNTPVGTMEISPYHPEVFSTVENDFSFSSVPFIQENKSTVWEVDKVGLLKEHRKKGHVMNVVHCMMQHFEKYGMTHGIALFEYKFYRFLRMLVSPGVFEELSPKFRVPGELLPIIPVAIHGDKANVWYKDFKEEILQKI